MFAPKNILVPTDFSESSDMALAIAIEMAKHFNAKVHLLHVLSLDMQQCSMDYCIPHGTYIKVVKDATAQSKINIAKQVKKIPKTKDVEFTYAVKQGIVYGEINEYQRKKAIDLIVMSRHGRTGWLKHLMGGVTEKVMHTSKCPVLLLPD